MGTVVNIGDAEVRMRDTRKSIKVPSTVKAEIECILKELEQGKTEAFAIAYLASMYKDQKSKRITLSDHQAYLRKAEEMTNQISF